MAASRPPTDQRASEGTEVPPLDRDEKVKLDLPFGTALRALLKTPPPEPAEKLPAPRKP
jgi:hypothetical protein